MIMKEKKNITYEIVVFGAAGVGKTSIVRRFYLGEFTADYEPTVEDCYSRVLNKDGSIIVLNTTDSAGSYQFPAMREVAIQRAAGFIMVYSLDNKFSFEELKRLLDEVIENKKNHDDIPVVLVGNKKDLDGSRELTTGQVVKEITEYAQQKGCTKLNMRQMETSAKDNHNVGEVFDEVIDLLANPPGQTKIKRKKKLFKRIARDGCTIL